jgi:hypothetical protein
MKQLTDCCSKYHWKLNIENHQDQINPQAINGEGITINREEKM